jgi:type VI protein secretion system component VasF
VSAALDPVARAEAVARRRRVRLIRRVVLTALWVGAVLVTVAVLYGALHLLDWFIQVVHEPPGRDRQVL